MQSKPMTSASNPRVLTRSRSLALPLGDLDLSTPLDCPGGARGGAGSGDFVQQTKADPRRDAKKPMRRQKSLAELFGVVIYKSKVQLQELFSRRDKDSSRSRKTDASPIQAEAGATGGTAGAGTEVGLPSMVELEGAAGLHLSGACADTSPRRQGPNLVEELVSVIPGGPGYSDQDLNSRSVSTGRISSRTPEELFCVTKGCGSVERPVFTCSLDTLHRDKLKQSSDSDISSPNNTGRLLQPDTGFTGKKALVKCNSDSICRLVLPLSEDSGVVPLTKASSDDACFVRRHSPQLLPRDSNIKFNTKSKSSSSSPQTSSDSLSCISFIVDWMLVGSVEAAYNEPLLCSLNVEAVVDITNVAPHRVPAEKKTTCPCTCNKKHFRSKLNLAVDDIEWENIEQHFEDVNAFINGWRQRGKRVLVVSYHGKSRAPAVAVQHLMTYYHISMDRALAYVRSKRLQTRINPGFMRALQRLEKRLADQGHHGSPPSSLPDLNPPCPRTAWDEC
ncbi:uncharacterized protein LOC143283509 [Babylonia areolata]|uniref:uncharacterized protein LOC143283509 n=1 Tax=Babylonia areolata TaxID=304850 RepID=UPI003FD270BF